MTVIVIPALVMLAIAGLLCLIRLMQHGSVANRMIALDLLLIVIVIGIGVHAFATRSGTYLDLLVVVSLLGFVGTTTVARFIERRGP